MKLYTHLRFVKIPEFRDITVLPRVKRHAGISEGEHILRNVSILSSGMPV